MVTAYPVAGKMKCLTICQAFVAPIGGKVSNTLRPGPAFFFGVNESNLHIWREVVRTQREYWYCDNSYFDSRRQVYFRIAKNRLQHDGLGVSTGERFRATGIKIEPWRTDGQRIMLCPQSDDFMRHVVGANRDWVPRTQTHLASFTKREVTVRPWMRDKRARGATLNGDLVGTHALVTWSSAAAVTALLAGVPAVVLGQSAAEPMATPLAEIERPRRLDREEWAGVLADNEWSLEEVRSGMAWEKLHA